MNQARPRDPAYYIPDHEVPASVMERGERLDATHGPALKRLLRDQPIAMLRALHKEGRRIPTATAFVKLRELIDEAQALMKPFTPCGGGCSHCCHMPTYVYGWEAQIIGRYVKRKPVKFDVEPELADVRARYTAVPCTFLEAGRCSIYEVRPLACRAHHVLDDDETNCELYSGPKQTHSYSNEAWECATTAFLAPTGMQDIRDWFPGTAGEEHGRRTADAAATSIPKTGIQGKAGA